MTDSLALSFLAVRRWNARRWLITFGAASAVLIFLTMPTAMIDTPWFSREIEPTWWSWPVAIATALATGLLLASYVAEPTGREVRSASAGGLLAYFAVGCPVCNKLVLIALGSSGAMTWFAPLQPLLAVAALLLVGWALLRRLRGEVACDVPRP